jgi:hypothetical protein
MPEIAEAQALLSRLAQERSELALAYYGRNGKACFPPSR